MLVVCARGCFSPRRTRGTASALRVPLGGGHRPGKGESRQAGGRPQRGTARPGELLPGGDGFRDAPSAAAAGAGPRNRRRRSVPQPGHPGRGSRSWSRFGAAARRESGAEPPGGAMAIPMVPMETQLQSIFEEVVVSHRAGLGDCGGGPLGPWAAGLGVAGSVGCEELEGGLARDFFYKLGSDPCLPCGPCSGGRGQYGPCVVM